MDLVPTFLENCECIVRSLVSPRNELQFSRYSNSLMVTLNARKSTRTKLSNQSGSDAIPNSSSYPMQVLVARQMHTSEDGDADLNAVSRHQTQVRDAGSYPKVDYMYLPPIQEKGDAYYGTGNVSLVQLKDTDR